MNGPIPFTEKQLQNMAEMYRSGKNLAQVGEHFGISAFAVRARLLTMGEPTRPLGRVPLKPTALSERCKRLRAQGKTIADISKLTGLHPSSIYRHLARKEKS